MSQTSIIAHKSHSGQMSNFSTTDYDDNLGLPSPRLVEIIKLNDSMAVLVEIQPMMSDIRMYDTIISHPIEKRVEDYLKYRNVNNINLVGFDDLKTKMLKKRKNQEEGNFYLLIQPKLKPTILCIGLGILVIITSLVRWKKRKILLQ